MRIVTDSRTPEEPKDPDTCNLYQIYRLFAAPDRLSEVRQLYLEGGLAYGVLKQELFETILTYFGPARQKYSDLINDLPYLNSVLAEGAEKARAIGQPVIHKIRRAIGLDA